MSLFLASLNIQIVLVGLGALLILYLIAPIFNWLIPSSKSRNDEGARTPPIIPYTLPILKSTIPFLFDGLNFFSRAS